MLHKFKPMTNKLDHVNHCGLKVMTCGFMLCHVMLCYVRLCYGCYARYGYAMLF